MSSVLLAKLLLGPSLVVATSLAGRRWGPTVSGVLVAIPMVLGPILLLITIEQGDSFGADAAAASLLGLVALATFTVVFARVGRSQSWAVTTAAGWTAFILVALVTSQIDVPPVAAAGAAIAGFSAALVLIPPAPHPAGPRTPPPAWDLPARAVTTAALIVTVTGVADTLGPSLAGALAPFPIATTVVAAFVLAQDGPFASTEMMRGFVRGIFGAVGFSFLVAVLLAPLGAAAAYAIGFAGVLVVQGVVLVAMQRDN